MRPHDYKGLNDFECWHVEHFAEQYRELGWRLHGDATAFRVARARAQERFPLDRGEAARVDAYVASRFGAPKARREPAGLPAPALVAS
jgi:hypothetical protein